MNEGGIYIQGRDFAGQMEMSLTYISKNVGDEFVIFDNPEITKLCVAWKYIIYLT